MLFPISMNDPTQLNKAILEDMNGESEDNSQQQDSWYFIKPEVFSQYKTKASNNLNKNDLEAYSMLIGRGSYTASSSVSIECPSYVYDENIGANGELYPLYGHRFLYLQNGVKTINDSERTPETRLYAKAYAFLMGVHGG